MSSRVSIAILVAFTLATLPLAAQEPIRVTEQGIMLDFQDADLRLVVAALAEAGSLNVLHGDLPNRRVTLRTTQPVAVTQILGLLRSLARANQLEMVEEDGFVRLEASTAAASAAQDTTTQQEMRLHVYRLRHGRADRIGATLQNLFGAGRTAPASRTTARPSLSQSLRDQRIPPVETDTVAVAPPAPPQPDQGLRADIRGELQIVPDESTNSLLVRATATDWIVIEQAIQALDLRPLQVLIEVVIAEVRRTKDLDVGVSFQATDTRNAGRTTET
jgi:type II secretory pathway component GspD/PulD (secretin)